MLDKLFADFIFANVAMCCFGLLMILGLAILGDVSTDSLNQIPAILVVPFMIAVLVAVIPIVIIAHALTDHFTAERKRNLKNVEIMTMPPVGTGGQVTVKQTFTQTEECTF